MIDFSKIGLTAEFILSKIDESQVFYYYHGPFELRKAYPSKLRRDRNPSTSFFISKTGNILYKDFSNGKTYNCFTFVAELYKVSYHDALHIIATDFGLIDGTAIKAKAQQVLDNVEFDKSIKKETIIQVIPTLWTNKQLKYWNQYHISIDTLGRNNVYPVKRLFVNKMEYSIDELCFAYLVRHRDEEGKDYEYLKIYQPQRSNENGKWISNVPISVPFSLYEAKISRRLPSDHVVIGKAKKDEMVLQSFFEWTIASQNESEGALLPHVPFLQAAFKRQTIIWDADETGVQNCKKFNSKGFGYFNTPAYLLERGIKDVSDYVKAFGMKALERLLKSKGTI
jgi:hypothetical protein